MAIRVRRGNQANFDGNKLVAGELGLVLDKGELYFCYSPGNTKRLQTAEDLQNLLNASPEAYQALQQLVSDLTANPNELANILSNISALQTDKFDKANIVQTDTIGGVDKVASAEVVKAHGLEIDGLVGDVNTLNNNLVQFRTDIFTDTSVTDLTLALEKYYSGLTTYEIRIVKVTTANAAGVAIMHCFSGAHAGCLLIGSSLATPEYGRLLNGVWEWKTTTTI